ncbi:MAG TPA: hypothetical protein EYQ26_00395 [Rhodospirillales bacterium]|nr:hypothetical protein [Rhodospirillales bacterium]
MQAESMHRRFYSAPLSFCRIVGLDAHNAFRKVGTLCNSKVQLAKRRARSYRNTIYFLCGKMKFDYSLYFI